MSNEQTKTTMAKGDQLELVTASKKRFAATVVECTPEQLRVELGTLWGGQTLTHTLRRIDGEWRDEGGSPVGVWKDRPRSAKIEHPEKLEQVHEAFDGEHLTLTYACHDDGPDQVDDERVIEVTYEMAGRDNRGAIICMGPITVRMFDMGDGGHKDLGLVDVEPEHLAHEMLAGDIATKLSGGVESYWDGYAESIMGDPL